jgi:hypothetical protein
VESASTLGRPGAKGAPGDPGMTVMSRCCRFPRNWSDACGSAA